MMGGLRSLKDRLMWKVDSLGMMAVQGWMTNLLESLTTSLVLGVKVRHCASASGLIHSIVSFVVIVQTVLEGL